jgi:23S rRNA (guanosine2251-2'-O)-methyltransferase
VEPLRRYLAGAPAIHAALERDEPVRVLLVGRDDTSEDVLDLRAEAERRGVALWLGSPGDLRRMTRGPEPERALAMLGPDPRADLDQLLSRAGAIWLLHGVAYPSNVGFAVRTAEVSGAQGVIVDASFNHHERARIAHVSMGADRLLPVLYEKSGPVLTAARAAGFRIVALEDVGSRAASELDLTGAVLFVVGGERDGLGRELLAQCHAVVRIPMAGFVPSYNLQGALSALAAERLRQLGAR